jgi:hypothetical protein
MLREYAAIKIANPITKNNLVRLSGNQKLNISLSLPEYDEAEINVLSDFLILENREDSKKAISLVYRSHVPEALAHLDLFLGELYVASGPLEASLCVLRESAYATNNSLLSIVNPNGHTCRFEHFQNINVMFFHKNIESYVISHGNYIKLCEKSTHNSLSAQSFFFTLTADTINSLHELPHGRYDSGNIVFKSRDNNEYKLNLILNWKEKKVASRRIRFPTINIKRKKFVSCSNISFKKLDGDIDAGCKVVLIGD